MDKIELILAQARETIGLQAHNIFSLNADIVVLNQRIKELEDDLSLKHGTKEKNKK